MTNGIKQDFNCEVEKYVGELSATWTKQLELAEKMRTRCEHTFAYLKDFNIKNKEFRYELLSEASGTALFDIYFPTSKTFITPRDFDFLENIEGVKVTNTLVSKKGRNFRMRVTISVEVVQ